MSKTEILCVGGPADGKFVELHDNCSYLHIPMQGGGGFIAFEYARRAIGSVYVLAPDAWSDEEILKRMPSLPGLARTH